MTHKCETLPTFHSIAGISSIVIAGHMPPEGVTSLEVVTIKTKGWVLTFRP